MKKFIKLFILSVAFIATTVCSRGQNPSASVITIHGLSRDSLILIPPTNLQAVIPLYTNYIHLTWLAPQGNKFSVPDGLLGYNLYRDSVLISFIATPETEYYDLNLLPDEYIYHVSALYDLSSYGYPGETGESPYDGPVIIDTYYAKWLPFDENFNMGLFIVNQWVADTLNWHINAQSSNMTPCAEFSSTPIQSDYAFSLTSTWLDGRIIDQSIFLEFDIKLEDISSNGQEVLLTEILILNGSNWEVVGSDTAQGNFDWETRHFDITVPARGHIFRIRFTAKGISTTNINYWQVDNIHVFNTCPAPTNLEAKSPYPNTNCTVKLNWSAPLETTRELMGYNIYRDLGTGNFTNIGSTELTTYIDDISGLLEEEDTVHYAVISRFTYCSSDFSNVAQVLGSVCTVSVENFELEPVEIFPNPAGTIATINMNEDIDKFIIYDRLGNKIYTSQINNSGKQSLPLNVTVYPNGIYFIRFITKKGKSFGKKLIVLH